MRKNGVDRELRPIAGGVCAPVGFSANAVFYDTATFTTEGNGFLKNALALIKAEKDCPTACVYASGTLQGAPIAVTKKHLQNGRAQAILVNSGVANVFQEDGEKIAENLCKELAKNGKVDVNDVVVASTGKIGEKLSETPLIKAVPFLVEGLNASSEKSLAVAEALRTSDRSAKQLSYEFFIGDVVCRIGAVFKGNACVCPNMATMLAFLTTDVNISSAMLQKALISEVKDSLNLMDIDNVSSPNDTVCIMANGRANNYKITQADSEYKKFCYALHEVMKEICLKIVADGEENAKTFICKISGGRSKQVAREVARSLVGNATIKNSLLCGDEAVERIVYAVIGASKIADLSKLQISILSDAGSLTVCEEGKPLRFSPIAVETILQARTVRLHVDYKEGNYASEAFGRIDNINK